MLASRRDPGTRPRTMTHDQVHVTEMPDVAAARLRHGGLSPLDILGRMAWVSRRSFDVIHTFEHRPAVSLPALVGKHRGAVLVSDWSDLWGRAGIGGERKGPEAWILGTLDEYWETRYRKWADAFTTINATLWDRVEGLGLPEPRRLMLPPGANVDLIRPLPQADMRRLYSLPKDAHVVVATGFAPYDEDLLSETIVEILSLDPAAWALTSGAERTLLQYAVRTRGLEGRLRVLGRVPFSEMERVLACADVLLLPYSHKPVNLGRFPNRFGDYLAAGRAIVTQRIGDLGELVVRHGLGLIAPEEPAGFAAAAVHLMEDPALCEELGTRARRFAEDHLSWEALAHRVENFYSEVLKARQTGSIRANESART
jgi:glycosyltransferase involved in cell wall biosynthesis